MKVAIIAPDPPPGVQGGTERAVGALARAISAEDDTHADVVKIRVDESNLPAIVRAYEQFSQLDLRAYDRVISVKYPAWMVSHPNHAVFMFHPLRGLYDTYHLFGLPNIPKPESAIAQRLLGFMARNGTRDSLFEFFGQFDALAQTESPDLAFPGPIARAIVHWLDRIALSTGEIRDYFALSRTVAARTDYFPADVEPTVVTLPGDLPISLPHRDEGTYLFTASRFDGPKRIGLIIDAMAHVHADIPLRIAGSGPLEAELKERARGDARIEFLGYVSDSDLVDLYRGAIAVPFVPVDEDLGLIPIEAAGQGTPVVTCRDSGGPTEFVSDGVNGLLCYPTPASLGTALDRISSDPAWARRMGGAAHRKAAGYSWHRTAITLLGSTKVDQEITPPHISIGARPKVVSLATYGIDKPAHGGQLRVNQLCRALSKIMDVRLIALDANATNMRSADINPNLTSTVIPRHPDQIRIEDTLGIQAAQPVTDVFSGINAHLTPDFVSHVTKQTENADLIVLEQPFLYPLLDHFDIDVPFVVNTQNVEHDLRVSTLDDSPLRASLIELVGQIEALALTRAESVTACSIEDAKQFEVLYGVRSDDVSLIPNGTTLPKRISTIAERRRLSELWIRRFAWNRKDDEFKHLGIFFGSWHPPNIDAAEFLIELAQGQPELLVVSAGNHGLAFAGRELPSNIIFPGPVPDRVKGALLESASVALNPMRTGSGTNLKIIEFLGNGVPTVSTPFGARGLGLEDGTHLILRSPQDFAEGIDAALADPLKAQERVDAARAFIEIYDWSVIGARYRSLISQIIELDHATEMAPWPHHYN